MYNIPTRSDVSEALYKKAVDIENVKNSLSFSFLFGNCDIHNAKLAIINGKKDVDSENILENYVQKAEFFHGTLIKSKIMGYLNDKIVTGYSSNHPNFRVTYDTNTGEHVRRQLSRTLDTELVSIKPMSWLQEKFRFNDTNLVISPVNYSFNPAQLAISEVEKYILALKHTSNKYDSLMLRLDKLDAVVTHFDDNANLDLFKGVLFQEFDSPMEIERNVNTEAGKLKKQNDEIAKVSDVYIRFDEKYLVIRGKNPELTIPLIDVIVNNSFTEDECFILGRILQSNGKVVVNGRQFGKEILTASPLEILKQR